MVETVQVLLIRSAEFPFGAAELAEGLGAGFEVKDLTTSAHLKPLPGEPGERVVVLCCHEAQRGWPISSTDQQLVLLPPGLTPPPDLSPGQSDFCYNNAPLVEVVARIRARAGMARQLERERDIDPLTGTLTAKAFRERMNVLQRLEVAFLLVDIDNCMRLNYEYGYEAGDGVIASLARSIERELGPDGILGRVSGSIFGVLLPGADEAAALRRAEFICEAVSEYEFPVSEGRHARVTVSVGVAASVPRDGEEERSELIFYPGDQSTLWQQAEMALVHAKAHGRNRAVGFDAMLQNMPQETSLERLVFSDLLNVTGQRASARIDAGGSYMLRQAERKRLEAERRAAEDALTRLGNRAAFEKSLPREFEAARANRRPLALALIDVDSFGTYNKRYGWPMGDKVLREMGRLIRENTRSSDLAMRYGGDEFVVIMPSADANSAVKVADRIVTAAAANPLEPEGIPVTLCVGVATLQPQDPDPQALLARASSALLKAKGAGKARAVLAESSPNTGAP